MPPIDKNEDNQLLENPHVFLDEVMRQAEESEIIRLTMDIRNKKEIKYDKYKNEVKIFDKNNLNTGMLQWADQVLVATNNTRMEVNNQMRSLLGLEGGPQEGDKVICLRNYWDIFSEKEFDPLVNGTIGYIKNGFRTFRDFPRYIKADNHRFDIWQANFVVDNDYYENMDIDYLMLTKGEKCCDWRVAYKLGQLKNKIGDIVPKEFAYAYAITGWKAQGSEWDKVLAIEENFPYDKETHAKFLYTACTRATSKLVLVRNL